MPALAQLSLPIPIAELRATLRAFGVSSAQLFGSYARGEQTADSDIDVLVQLLPGTSLFMIVALEGHLSERTGVRFDIATAIREPFLPYIEPDLVDLGV